MTKGNLIIGAGGHGKVVADAMQSQKLPVLGFLDDDPDTIGNYVLGLPVLGKSSAWANYHPDGLIVGVGNNTIRHKIVQKLENNSSIAWLSVAHQKAIIADSVEISHGTAIMAGAVINVDSFLGKHSIINTGATVDHDCIIGDFVHIAPGVHLAGEVHIEDNAFLGIGCSVIPGCRIGSGTIIGAGATVICDIPPNVVAKGIPARW